MCSVGIVTLMLILAGLQASAASLLQSRINVTLKNARIEELIKAIESQTDLGFLFNASELKNVKPITINAKNETVENILSKALDNTGLEFEIENKTILIKASHKPTSTQQEKRTITGTVFDEGKKTLPGVTIIQKGMSTNGTSTNMDGKFSMRIPANGKVTLVFSFIGMNNQEVVVTDQQNLNVVMTSAAAQIDEVVVTGYQKVSRKLFTGSATLLKSEDAKTAGESDVSRMLEGKVAGVSVQNVSSTFGAAPKIRVRGSSAMGC
jgi:hypothetical protein